MLFKEIKQLIKKEFFMKEYWGYVDNSGHILVKQYVNKTQVKEVLFSKNIAAVIMPFLAPDLYAAHDHIDSFIKNAQ
jgi:hypothetical protein